MNCPNCYAPVPDGATTCSNCGRDLTAGAAPATAGTTASTTPGATPFQATPSQQAGAPTPMSAPYAQGGEFSKYEQEALAPKTGRQGWGDILAGVVLIGIGLFMGGSIFTGDATWIDYFFDGLGIFWLVRGIVRLVRSS